MCPWPYATFWRLGEDCKWKLSEMGNGALAFLFEEEEDCRRIFERRPWSVQGAHLTLKEWPQSGCWQDADFSATTFWIQAHGLPISTTRRKMRFSTAFWVQLKFEKLYMFCSKCGRLGHAENRCFSEVTLTPMCGGRQVQLYGP